MNNRFTKSAQAALENAIMTARKFGHSYIGSEHVLLGLLSESECVASKLLEKYNVSFDSVKNAVEDISGGGEETNVG
ncbi:MAG: Clp protease N-terminal domain-containing protein, partial [Clostridia bacterium]|nr:Clp protease N-terminal domain-containing protein [Clostridia bacterium]